MSTSVNDKAGKGQNDLRWGIGILGFIIVCWIWFSTFQWTEQEYAAEIYDVQREENNLTKAFEEHVRRTISGVDNVLQLTKHEYEENGGDSIGIKIFLQWARYNPVMNGQMNIVNENGDYIASALPSRGVNIADREYFQVHVRNPSQELFVDAPVMGRVTGKESMHISRRLEHKDGTFAGIVSATLNPEYFSQFYQQMELGASWSVVLLGSDGVVRAYYYKGETAAGKEFDGSELVSKSGESLNGTFESAGIFANQTHIQSYRVITDLGLIVAIGIDKQDALKDFYERKKGKYQESLFATALIIAISLLLAWHMGQKQKNYQKTARQEELLKAMVDAIPHRVWLKDQDGAYVVVNQSFARAASTLREKIPGKKDEDIFPKRPAYHDLEQVVMETGRAQMLEVRANLADEWLEIHVAPVCDGEGHLIGVTGVAQDVTERREAGRVLQQKNDEIYRMAYSDSLTGLPNRTHLRQRLGGELEKARRGEGKGAVIFIDLDDLKVVNDAFGHTFGDAIIIAAGAYIVAETTLEAFVARIGGDEFVVILPGTNDRDEIGAIADGIIHALSREYDDEQIRFQLSASAGIVVYPEDCDSVDDIMKNADNAMYAAKKAGKNQWRFYEAMMATEAYERISLINHLRHAVEREELLLYYQPQVTMNHRTVGFEALLRWKNDEYGWVSPGKFIPLAEESRLIDSIGEWVLQEACSFIQRLQRSGYGDLYVAVNVSPYQLLTGNFVSKVKETIARFNVRPEQLEFEITETALMGPLEESIHQLNLLDEMGIRLALDDFGTGYSSLTYLQRFPVKTMKIDKSFIDLIVMENASPEIITSLVNMAHAMGMRVVAEGVEASEQFVYLIQSGCDLFQGYLVSRPVPAEDALLFLENPE